MLASSQLSPFGVPDIALPDRLPSHVHRVDFDYSTYQEKQLFILLCLSMCLSFTNH
jgi:hypothetical protein